MSGRNERKKKRKNDNSPEGSLQKEEIEGKQKLIREIESNAKEEAEQIIRSAEKTKNQKIAAAEGKAKRIVKDAEERAEAKISRLRERNDSSIQIRKKRIRLKQTEEIIGYIFTEVKKRIKEKIGTPEYGNTLRKWAVEGALGVGSEAIIISASEEELPLLTKDFMEDVKRRVKEQGGGDITITVGERPEGDYGICVYSSDGRLEYRNQINTRLARKQNEYRKKIYSTLEIEGTP